MSDLSSSGTCLALLRPLIRVGRMFSTFAYMVMSFSDCIFCEMPTGVPSVPNRSNTINIAVVGRLKPLTYKMLRPYQHHLQLSDVSYSPLLSFVGSGLPAGYAWSNVFIHSSSCGSRCLRCFGGSTVASPGSLASRSAT